MAIFTKERIASGIIFRLSLALVHFAIDLDRETKRAAIKIGDIGSDTVPLAELYPKLLSSKLLPKQNFSQ